MTRIPFAEIRFFDPAETQRKLEDRLQNHLRCLRGHPDINELGGDEALANFLALRSQKGLDAQAATHRPHRKLTSMLGHERVSHFASLAKYAVAFFRMSRSSETRASSRFSRRISASFSVSPDTAFANLRLQA